MNLCLSSSLIKKLGTHPIRCAQWCSATHEEELCIWVQSTAHNWVAGFFPSPGWGMRMFFQWGRHIQVQSSTVLALPTSERNVTERWELPQAPSSNSTSITIWMPALPLDHFLSSPLTWGQSSVFHLNKICPSAQNINKWYCHHLSSCYFLFPFKAKL